MIVMQTHEEKEKGRKKRQERFRYPLLQFEVKEEASGGGSIMELYGGLSSSKCVLDSHYHIAYCLYLSQLVFIMAFPWGKVYFEVVFVVAIALQQNKQRDDADVV
ncbi:hypothetical protein VNO77_16945 [Canavalia gladiata]|uniref:Uncharacterized protein n=1 Tax=Canavalia gladiata TaxID=3824 RepID=A0AAN9LI41_CANGL